MAKATRKTKPRSLRKSAVQTAYRSGFELVPKRNGKVKLASEADYAKIEFKAWTKEEGEKLVPGADVMNVLGFWSRAAYAIMLRSKPQLIQAHGEMEHELVDNLMGGLADTEEKIEGLGEDV